MIGLAGGANAFEQHAGGFVVAAFAGGEGVFGGDEFASEGFGQQRLREAVDVRLRLPQPGLIKSLRKCTFFGLKAVFSRCAI